MVSHIDSIQNIVQILFDAVSATPLTSRIIFSTHILLIIILLALILAHILLLYRSTHTRIEEPKSSLAGGLRSPVSRFSKQELCIVIANIEQHLTAIEQSVEQERETLALVLERLTPRGRTSRKRTEGE